MSSEITVTNNTSAHRYEIELEGHIALLEYIVRGNVIAFNHTETPEELRGRGLAAILTKHALDAARAAGQKVIPQCSYVDSYINKHPEYADLVA